MTRNDRFVDQTWPSMHFTNIISWLWNTNVTLIFELETWSLRVTHHHHVQKFQNTPIYFKPIKEWQNCLLGMHFSAVLCKINIIIIDLQVWPWPSKQIWNEMDIKYENKSSLKDSTLFFSLYLIVQESV
jgi:hypothetical protein